MFRKPQTPLGRHLWLVGFALCWALALALIARLDGADLLRLRVTSVQPVRLEAHVAKHPDNRVICFLLQPADPQAPTHLSCRELHGEASSSTQLGGPFYATDSGRYTAIVELYRRAEVPVAVARQGVILPAQ